MSEQPPADKPRVVLAFGTAASAWLLPTYEPLSRQFDLVVLAPRATAASAIVRPVRTARHRLGLLPRRFRPAVDQAIYWLWPDWDTIVGLRDHLADAAVVHTVELHSGTSLQAARAKARYGYRHVVTVWENIARRQAWHPRVAGVKAAVIGSADHLIAVSQRARTALLLEGVPEDRISVIGPGMVLPPNLPRRQPDRSRFRLLFVGKKQRSKGIEDLLYALWLARQDADLRGTSLTLTFLGVEPSRGPYAGLIRHYGLDDAITEIPFVPHDEVLSHYAEADALVVPSRITPRWQEQWGMVFMEAMSQKLPIITTHSGSIEEVTGEAALYARANDHHSLYQRIKELILDRPTWCRLSAAGRPIAESRFDVNVVYPPIAAVYRTLLN